MTLTTSPITLADIGVVSHSRRQPFVAEDTKPASASGPAANEPPLDADDGSTEPIERLLSEAERRALVAVLRGRPELTLEQLQGCFAGPYGTTLRSLTVGELLELEAPIDLPDDGGPPIDRGLLAQARRCSGEDYDTLVHDVIAGAGGRAVSASYLRARVGGPRWKLQGALRRLVAAGRIERRGVTSSTRYRIATG